MIRGNDGEWYGLPTYAVRKAREAMNNPLTRSTALETHPSWKAHDMASLDTQSEGYAAMELTGGFQSNDQLTTGIGHCSHSPAWQRFVRDAQTEGDDWADGASTPEADGASTPEAEAPLSDSEATEDARRAAPGYFRHP